MEKTTESSQEQELSPQSTSSCHCWTASVPRRALCTGLHGLWMANSNISGPHHCTLMLLNYCRSRNSHFIITSPRVWWTSRFIYTDNSKKFFHPADYSSACPRALWTATELNWPLDFQKHLWKLAAWRELWTATPGCVHPELYTSRLLERSTINLYSVHTWKDLLKTNIKRFFFRLVLVGFFVPSFQSK